MYEVMKFIWLSVLQFSCTQKHVNVNTKHYKKVALSIFMPGLEIMVKGVTVV